MHIFFVKSLWKLLALSMIQLLEFHSYLFKSLKYSCDICLYQHDKNKDIQRSFLFVIIFNCVSMFFILLVEYNHGKQWANWLTKIQKCSFIYFSYHVMNQKLSYWNNYLNLVMHQFIFWSYLNSLTRNT